MAACYDGTAHACGAWVQVARDIPRYFTVLRTELLAAVPSKLASTRAVIPRPTKAAGPRPVDPPMRRERLVLADHLLTQLSPAKPKPQTQDMCMEIGSAHNSGQVMIVGTTLAEQVKR